MRYREVKEEMQELISIIVPVYNVEKYIGRCLNSIERQSYPNIEIVLVDDGSKDNSGFLCDKFALNNQNAKVIHKENEGLGFARNTGLHYATGKYIVFVDSDDYLEHDMILNLYTDLILSKADACIGGFRRVCGNKVTIKRNEMAGKIYTESEIKEYILPRMLGKQPNGTDYIEMSVWKVLFKTDIIKKYDLKFPSERKLISEDIVFDLDYYSKCHAVCMSSDCGYCYCDNEGTLTTRYRPERFDLQKELYLYLAKRTKELGIDEISETRRMTTFISNTRYCIKLEAKFLKQNGQEKMLNNIKRICMDDLTQEIFLRYDHAKVPLKSRIINKMIMNKQSALLAAVMILRERLHV